MVLPQKQSIIQFIKRSYNQTNKTPSLRRIIAEFNKDDLNFAGFYQLFPGRLAEACRLAGVPIPQQRIEKTSNAVKAIQTKTKKMQTKTEKTKEVTRETKINCLTLSEEQTKRLLGISHLENGEDPLLIIDDLLERDSLIRKHFHLSLPDTKRVATFIQSATEAGWALSSEPNKANILAGVTDFWNLVINPKLSPDTVNSLIQLLIELKAHKWIPTQFVNEASQASYAVYWFRQFKAGNITLQDFAQKVSTLQ